MKDERSSQKILVTGSEEKRKESMMIKMPDDSYDEKKRWNKKVIDSAVNLG